MSGTVTTEKPVCGLLCLVCTYFVVLRKSLLNWFIHLKAIHDAEAVLELARKKAEASKEALAQVRCCQLCTASLSVFQA